MNNLIKIDNVDFELDPIIGIEEMGVEQTYDIEVEDVHAFYAKNTKNNYVSISHNSAHIAILSCDHPDVESFITAKQGDSNKQLTQFNISVEITDAFMEAVQKDLDWDLKFKGNVFKTVKARDIYELLCKNAYIHNEPGVLFTDAVNKYNNGYWAFDIHECNPCGEIQMPKYNLCDLTSYNLVKFVNSPYKKNASFDFESFKASIPTAIRFLDNVLDVTEYPLEKIKIQSKQWRRIGLGFTGLGDMFAMLGIPYGSQESKELSEKIGQVLRDEAYRASCMLAKEKGSFPAINIEKLMESNFIKQLPSELQELIKVNGLRNIGILTIPPAGTLSITVGNNCSSGIEPIFALEYYRNIRTDNKEGTTKELVQDYAWMKFNQIKDSLTKEEVDRCMKAFVTTDTIDVRDAIDIQAIFQKYIDHSISKTANLPNDYTFEQYKDLFMYAWKKGLKGFTSFNPNGSLKGILETSNNSSTTITIVNNRPTEIVDTHAPKRPDVLNCHIHQTTIKGTKWVFFVGILNNRPYEILGGKEEYINIPKKYIKGVDTINSWIVKKKVGSDTHYNLVIGSLDKASDDYQLFENIAKIFPVEMGTPTRLISSLLRHGMPIKDIMLQLEKVPQEDSLYTFESGIKRVLKHYIKDGIDSKDICTECKSKMVFENGCKVCKNCGNSKCG